MRSHVSDRDTVDILLVNSIGLRNFMYVLNEGYSSADGDSNERELKKTMYGLLARGWRKGCRWR